MPSESEKDLLRLNGLKPRGRKERRARRRLKLPSGAAVLRGLTWLGVAVAFFYVGTWALRPHLQAWLVTREFPELEQRRRSADRERRELEWQVRYARSEDGAGNLARVYGYVREGEVPVVLPKARELAQDLEPAKRPEVSLWERFLLALCRICGADPDAADASGRVPRS